MSSSLYDQFVEKSFQNQLFSTGDCLQLLRGYDVQLLPLLHAAHTVRRKKWGNTVQIHVINNGQNGHCPEDCSYCVQAKTSEAGIDKYPIKSEDEFMAEAKMAHERGAFRYCMVFSGRGPSNLRIQKLAGIIQKIKETYPIQVCLSAGLISPDQANTLKAAGLDRLNHNLNTSETHYEKICTTHTFQDRLNTLNAAKSAGLEMCSGLIVGLGESDEDVIDVAMRLKELNVKSIPVNFFMPIEGAALTAQQELTPDYCLRVLCLFRFLNPDAEIRVAAGREMHLRSLQALAFYPANSLFLDGYLNTKGSTTRDTLQMIKDAGFSISSDVNLDDLLSDLDGTSYTLKTVQDLRPSAATVMQESVFPK